MSENHLFLQLFGRTSYDLPRCRDGQRQQADSSLCNMLKWPVNSTREVIV